LSYQVIARKYRPQTFADLAGQEHISRTLGYALDRQRLHHAYLFSGVRGTGKTTSARILAKGLNCHTGITSQPCLQCPSCLEIATGNSLDVLEIDAASNTGVDNVRDVIINNIALAPARDRYKVFVIDEVHMLSNSAFNALLKTLEEPPGHVVFIMATTELHKVPDTILSRCQQFEFRQIPAEKIFQRLRAIAEQEAIQIGDAPLREIARAGAGSLRDAQSAFDQVIAFSGAAISEEDVTSALGLVGARTLGNFSEAIATQNVTILLSLIEEISARGYDLRNFIRELMAYWRHILVVKSGITDSNVIGVADVEVAQLRELAKQFSEEDIVRGFHLLAETEKEIKDSPHPRFQLEIGLVKLAQIARLRSLSELIQRLEQLESNLLGGGGGKLPAPPLGSRAEPPSRLAKETAPPAPPKPVTKASPLPSTPQPFAPAAVMPTRKQAPIASSEEPPDFPPFDPFDEAPPEDLSEPDFVAAKPSRLSPPPSARPSTPQPGPARPSAPPAPARTVAPGEEIETLLAELNRLNKTLLVMAFEDAQVTYVAGKLTFVFASEDVIVKRVRESTPLLRDLGARLLGQPLTVEVKFSGEVTEVVDEAAQARAQLHKQASENPAVRMLLDKFKGEIISVRPAPQAASPRK
jgi:DNA polymerase-3 subunit gamma/tau